MGNQCKELKTESDIEGEIYFFQGNTDLVSKYKENTKATYKDIIDKIIKPKFNEFFNLKNVHFLLGSGTSSNSIPTMAGLFKTLEKGISSETSDKNILGCFDKIKDVNKGNLEQILSVLYSRREALKGMGKQSEKTEQLIGIIERHIFDSINVDRLCENYEKDLSNYQKFYQKLALRSRDMSRINVFTTNNDLFNERALDNLNIHYINGFGGGLGRFFNPALFNYTYSKRLDSSISKYEPVENLVYLYKIHGSINWVEDDTNINSFFKVKELPADMIKKGDNNVLIYPTPMKQNKSLGSPYVDLFREFQHKLLEPNGVLFVIGYSFSDEHVNDIIYRALATNTTFNLVILNDVKGSIISKVADNRIYRLWGKIPDGTKIHYFDYIVNKLLPNLDAFRDSTSDLEKFVSYLNQQKKEKDEDR